MIGNDVEFNIAALQAELELQQRSQILSSLWVAGAIIIFILIAFYLVSSRLKKDLHFPMPVSCDCPAKKNSNT